MSTVKQKPKGAPAVATADGGAYAHFRVKKLTPVIGAEIEGVDLGAGLAPAAVEEIRRAFRENLVIFFRGQTLLPEQHIAFGKLFGELHIHPVAPSEPGRLELMIIAADENSSRVNGEAGTPMFPATSKSISIIRTGERGQRALIDPHDRNRHEDRRIGNADPGEGPLHPPPRPRRPLASRPAPGLQRSCRTTSGDHGHRLAQIARPHAPGRLTDGALGGGSRQ